MSRQRYGPYGESPTYNAAHFMLRRELGPASAHECLLCPALASDWAFNGPGAHSRNPDDYAPLCRSCHWMLDRGRFWCDKHQTWAEQTRYRERNGRPVEHRICRECNREHGRRRSALIKEARTLLGLSSAEYVKRYGQGRATALQIIEERTP